MSAHSHNSLSDDKNISLVSENQPAVKVLQATSKKDSKNTVKNRKARNKIVPFKNAKEASEYVVGELVLAHDTGFCDWPAFIRSNYFRGIFWDRPNVSFCLLYLKCRYSQDIDESNIYI